MRLRLTAAAALGLVLVGLAPGLGPVPGIPGAAAQERLVVPSPVLTVDQEALFEGSAFGRRVQRELEEASAALAAENRRIEGELAAEERRLTEERAGMAPEVFRARAAEFDARVVEIRRTQDQKARDISRRPDEARQQFFAAALPVLSALVRERGAVAILDARAVILSADAIDITDEAIRRIDAELGDGSGAAPTPAPEAPAPDAPSPAAPLPEAPAPEAPAPEAPAPDSPSEGAPELGGN
jgi:Skp family chaperone for outer membrane proteins